MKNLTICGILLLITVLGPQQDHPGNFDALWALGGLALFAYILQQVADYLRLPALVGWLVAGLLLGASGLQLVRPADFTFLLLMRTLTGVWVGFQVGIHFSWPSPFNWRIPGLVGLITLVTFLLATVGIALIAEPPWWLAVLLGALASLWGLFTAIPTPAHRGALLLGTLGTCFGLILLSILLGLLQLRGLLPPAALDLVARLWLSLLIGAAGAELLRRLGLFAARASTLTTALLGSFCVAALFIHHLEFFALPCGFAAGLALTRHRGLSKRLRYLLRSFSPIVFMLFFALAGATIDLRVLSPPLGHLPAIFLILLPILVLLRALIPVVYYPLPDPTPQSRRQLGWLLLPKGALLFELIYHPRGSLIDLLGANPARLLHQVALLDILVHILLFSSIALLAERLISSRPSPAPTAEKTESAPAP